MGFAHRAILAGALGFAAAFVVACGGGGSGLLSGNQADTLKSQLDQVSSELASGNCSGVSSASDELTNAVANLPNSVNATLRNNLSQGASTVARLARRQCHPAETQTHTETTPTTDTATTPPATTTETTPATTPTTTTQTQTTPTTPHTTTTPATSTNPSGTTPTGTSGGVGLTGNPTGGSGTGGGGNGDGGGNGNGSGGNNGQ